MRTRRLLDLPDDDARMVEIVERSRWIDDPPAAEDLRICESADDRAERLGS